MILKKQNKYITETEGVVEELGRHFAKENSQASYTKEFRRYKNNIEKIR